jgi:hypothetical protein
MKATIKPLTQRPAWKALGAHHKKIHKVHIRELFADDPKRGERMAAEAAGIYFDYSKHRITEETLSLLLQLAEESGLRARIDVMFRGDKINVTEKHAVLHAALHAPKGQSIVVDGHFVAVIGAILTPVFNRTLHAHSTVYIRMIVSAESNRPLRLVNSIRCRQKGKRELSATVSRRVPPVQRTCA